MLHALAALRDAALALVAVDRLPAVVLDEIDAALPQDPFDSFARNAREEPRLGVLDQQLDGRCSVLLVRTDHAARAALDPTRAVDAGDAIAVVVDHAPVLVPNCGAMRVEREDR